MIRVVIADDQPLVRAGLRVLLGAQEGIEVVAEAATGGAAIAESARLAPDVVVMDIRMPGTDGITATAQVVRQPRAPRVLVLTTYDTDEYVYDALAAGASGFLLKDARPEDLIDGVRVVAAGDALLAPAVTRRLISLFTGGTPVRTRPDGGADARLDRLTEREREVFGLVARGLSNAEIGAALHVSGNTVKTHVARMLAKLGLRDRVHAVIFAYQSGWRPGELPQKPLFGDRAGDFVDQRVVVPHVLAQAAERAKLPIRRGWWMRNLPPLTAHSRRACAFCSRRVIAGRERVRRY